jgi:hypothetical protein
MADPNRGLRQRARVQMPFPSDDKLGSTTPARRRPRKPPQGETTLQSILHLIPLLGLLGVLYYLLNRGSSRLEHSRETRVRELQEAYADEPGGGHWDFGDGRESDVGEVWREGCQGCYWVNTMLGNGG